MGKLLDLIFSNNNTIHIEKSFNVAILFDPFHLVLDIVFHQIKDVPTINVSQNYYNFRKANYTLTLPQVHYMILFITAFYNLSQQINM